MEETLPSKKPRVFYGYWIVAAAFVCLFIFSGCGYFSFSLFVTPLQADFDWGRGEIMAAFTIYYLLTGVLAPFVGRLVDRYGARGVIAVGAFIAGLGFAVLSLASSLWHFYLGYAVVGIGMASAGPVPTTAIVSNWFKKRRGTAIGIMASGVGAGGLAIAPLVGSYLIPSFGWERSYLALAVITVVLIVPLALLVIRTRPAEMGLYPDSVGVSGVAEAETSSLATRGVTLRMALATTTLWLIALSYGVGNFSLNSVLQNQTPYLEDVGFPLAMAAGALGAVGLGSLVGKFSFGWLCDRVPAKYVWSLGLGLGLSGVIVLMTIRPASPVVLIWLYAILIGLSAGSWLPTMSMLVSTNFGLAAYGAIYGVVTLAQSAGVAAGPVAVGYLYDIMGDYNLAFIIALASSAVAILAILAVRRPKFLGVLREKEVG